MEVRDRCRAIGLVSHILDLLKIILASFTEDTNKFPDDAAFKLGFKDAQL